jgi:hypothetical protein
MGRIGKISSIKKKYPAGTLTVEATLANTYNKNRIPSTGVRKFPYRLANGAYRTGLEDKPEERERLEKATKLDLSPESDYYNFTSNSKTKTDGYKLTEGDNIFNLEDPWLAVTYYWLSAHPTIASSFQEFEEGVFTSDTEFYVNDGEVEVDRRYKKDLEENKAIGILGSMSVEKSRKVARMLGFPVTDSTKYEKVFTDLSQFIKQGTVVLGPYKGMNSINKFNQFAQMKNEDIAVMDLVEQGIKHSIFRVASGGRLMKGDAEIAKSKEDYIDFLKSKKGQEHLLQLEQDLGIKESILQ